MFNQISRRLIACRYRTFLIHDRLCIQQRVLSSNDVIRPVVAIKPKRNRATGWPTPLALSNSEDAFKMSDLEEINRFNAHEIVSYVENCSVMLRNDKSIKMPPSMLKEIVNIVESKVGEMRLSQLVKLFVHLTNLRAKPTDILLRRAQEMVIQEAENCNTQLCPRMFHALARWSGKVDDDFFQAVMTNFRVNHEKYDARGLSEIVWATATVSREFDQDCLSYLWEALETFHPLRQEHGGLVMWGLAKMKAIPSPQALARLDEVCVNNAPMMTPHVISLILWSFATMPEMKPSAELLQALDSRLAIVGVTSQTQTLSMILWSWAKLRHTPPKPLIKAMEACAVERIGSCPPQNLSQIIWSLSELKRPFNTRLCEKSDEYLSSMTEHMNGLNLSNILWAYGRWRHTPSNNLFKKIESRISDKNFATSPHQAFSFLVSMAAMNYIPDANVVGLLDAHIIKCIDSVSPRDISQILWAHGKFRYVPPPPLRDAIHNNLDRILESADTSIVLNTLWALGRIQLETPLPILERFHARILGDTTTSLSVSNIMHTWWAFSELKFVLPHDTIQLFEDIIVSNPDKFDLNAVIPLMKSMDYTPCEELLKLIDKMNSVGTREVREAEN